VLASLPATSAGLHALDVPRAFWEEQFGLVLPEAMAGGLTVLAAASGAIPEVVGGAATLFPAGDWLGLAAELARGPLSLAPGARVDHDPALLDRYSVHAAGARLAEVYDRVLAS
jgi:glycosyltransferase involved in cell wall biosynthesis